MDKLSKNNKKFVRYYGAIEYLERLEGEPLSGNYLVDRKNPAIYLKRMRYFLNMLGNLDRGFNFIHITGTSGKGTVTNLLHGIIAASGQRVGSFTSPHVVVAIERIKVGHLFISPTEFANLVDYLKPFIERMCAESPFGRPSLFEIYLAMAFQYFKSQNCQWVILEAGLGGRYDATNVIEKPIVTAITNIDFDHTDILGKTLKKIATDKAGIVKKGAAFFTSEQRPHLLDLFKKICHKNGVTAHCLLKQRNYQEDNVALATAIVKYLNIDQVAIEKGLKDRQLLGRFELVQEKPRIILDGAHNRAKMASTVYNVQKLKFNKLFLIIGISDNKDHLSILKEIVPLADHVYFTTFKSLERKCADPKILYQKSIAFFKRGAKKKIVSDAQSAVNEALAEASSNDLILVTGSFFLVGELRKRWFGEDKVLEQRS